MLYRTDENFLKRQYANQDNLSARARTHELYSQPKVDFVEWVLNLIPWGGGETVVDVGCGSGLYVKETRARSAYYLAGDLSLGMLSALGADGLVRVNMDAQRIPLADESADVILANHMLYHVPDRDAAVAEFARVLAPGGRLLAATNSAGSMAEFAALARAAWSRLEVPTSLPDRIAVAFSLENGRDLLGRHFSQVVRHDLPGVLLFPEAQPVVDYIGTAREQYEELLPSGLHWDDYAEALRQEVDRVIGVHGEFRVQKLAGAFVAVR